jgi:hypothetical protein
MDKTVKILLQTTIPYTEDDWHVGRFGKLRAQLAGEPGFEVIARDRDPPGAPDAVLSTLDRSDFDQLWLFAVDTGDGLTPEDCAAISRFRKRGGALMVTRDHMDLGSSVCSLGGVGAAHFFHSKNPDPDPARNAIDDRDTPAILWPNYHSGANGDFQAISAVCPVHPVLADPDAAGGALRYLPSHPHEGAVGKPASDPSARVIATGVSKTTGAHFNVAVAFEPSSDGGPRSPSRPSTISPTTTGIRPWARPASSPSAPATPLRTRPRRNARSVSTSTTLLTGWPPADRHQRRRTFFTIAENVSNGRSVVVIMPRMNTSDRPARTTSPRASTRSPTRAESMNSQFIEAVTDWDPCRSSSAMQNRA